MYSRLLKIDQGSKNSYFIFGPRGTGKTHWVQRAFTDAIYIDLLNSEVFRRLSSNPNHLDKMLPPNCEQWVIIDEIQKVPALLNEVHRLIENENIKFILTGSSARQLRKKGVNLLAGRALIRYMHCLTSYELGDDFDLASVLNHGLLPKTINSNQANDYLQSYVTTYLKEEVLEEGLSRQIGDFNRFLEIASFSQGSLLNMSQIAREVGINNKTVVSYFNILEDLLIGFKLPVFTKRSKRRLVSHPKFYFFDCGIYNILRPKGLLDRPSEINGAGLETIFIQHLRAYNDYFSLGYQFYFWRTSNQTEVDFVAYGEKGLFAFEIKHSNKVNRKDLSGLKSFASEYPMAKLFLIYTGDWPEYHDEIRVLPMVDALSKLPEILSGT